MLFKNTESVLGYMITTDNLSGHSYDMFCHIYDGSGGEENDGLMNIQGTIREYANSIVKAVEKRFIKEASI